MKWISTLLTTLFLLGLNPLYGDDDNRFPMDLSDLGLTQKQHRFVESAMREYQLSYRRYHHQSEKAQREMNALFLAQTFDEKSFVSKNLEIQKSSIEIRSKLLKQLHNILNKEQKRRFVHHLEEWEIE